MSMRNPSGFVRPGYNPLKVADAPTAVVPTAGVEGASVDFTPPVDIGGAPVTDYYAVVQPGNITATSVTPPVAVTGLTIGTTYTTKVWANNSYGPSPYSPQSGGFVPVAASYVEDVFSTYLYTGNSSTQTITNGIDLDGEGGLVWIKSRSSAVEYHNLFDTVRGAANVIFSNVTDAAGNSPTRLSSFNASGFTVGSNSGTNANAATYASWSWRKSPKFFDVVTYTGDGVAGRTVAHNLGSVPGCILFKRTDGGSTNWRVYHRSLGATKTLKLNTTDAEQVISSVLNDTDPTSTVFTVGSFGDVNGSGSTYVAYLFAHDAGGFGGDSEQNVISCGSFTTNGSGAATVSLGYEPQWILYKESSNGGENWSIADYMRGMPVTGNVQELFPNNASSESTAGISVRPNSTGFTFGSGWYSGRTFIYIAIRRGPMKTPTSGTEVFSTSTSSSTTANIDSGFVTDLAFTFDRSAGSSAPPYDRGVIDRLRGNFINLSTAITDGDTSNSSTVSFQQNNGIKLNGGGVYANGYVYQQFSRAPGFFDVVAYTGTGVTRTVAHNLGVAPELMIVKSRSSSVYDWRAYSITIGATKYLKPNGDSAEATSSVVWNDTTPTSSVFTVGSNATVNGSGETYIAYLFATLPGISKVGSYTGTGADLNVDCGFSAGARFILIKRTDSSGDWYVWDSARGIVAGNDPYLLLNNTAAEVTNTDYVDTLASGFTVTSSAPAALNTSGGSYIFLAIA